MVFRPPPCQRGCDSRKSVVTTKAHSSSCLQVLDIRWSNVTQSWRLGLRNYLFIGHPAAGWRSAVIYSVVGTCKLLGINAEAYLNWVMPQLAMATTRTVTGLLPNDFAALVHP
jgi:hypothetical protein